MATSPLYAVNGAYLYGRCYSVSVQRQTANEGYVWGNEAKGQTPLRVAFECEKKITRGNKGKVVLYNLSPTSRQLFVKDTPVRLRAGYTGNVSTLFVGIVVKVETTRAGPDITTSVELSDAEQFTQYATIDKPYAPGAHVADILNDIADAMVVTLDNKPIKVERGVAVGIPDHVYTNGFVASGPCGDQLTKICRPLGLEWSVQMGKLQIIPKDHYNCRQVVVLNDQTGLINVPASTKKNEATFQSLLNPNIVPGGLVQLDSKDQAVAGLYKVRKATYTGDTHDAGWQVAVEGELYTGQVKALPVAQGQSYQGAVLR